MVSKIVVPWLHLHVDRIFSSYFSRMIYLLLNWRRQFFYCLIFPLTLLYKKILRYVLLPLPCLACCCCVMYCMRIDFLSCFLFECLFVSCSILLHIFVCVCMNDKIKFLIHLTWHHYTRSFHISWVWTGCYNELNQRQNDALYMFFCCNFKTIFFASLKIKNIKNLKLTT